MLAWRMPTFVPLTKPRPLPKIGDAIERPVFDCKREPATRPFEMAKDVAAFANHLGGTLLIGAIESGEQLCRYAGLTQEEAGKTIRNYTDAVADRCWPRPTVDPESYDDPTDPSRRVVALNVQASPELVSVTVRADKANEGFGGDAYVFPVRSGNVSRYLHSGQLAMFMTPSVRRVAILLSKISEGSTVRVEEPRRHDIGKAEYRFRALREDENLVMLSDVADDSRVRGIPLDRITTVYQAPDSRGGSMWVMHFEPWNAGFPG